MFAKNGGDATTYAVTVARAATGRKKLLRARGAYHGATPWWTPVPAGVTPEDTANQLPYSYNDLESVHAAVNQAGDDLAAIIVSPFKHDARFDQEDVDPEFARGLREVCDATGAALILDEVRAGFRIDRVARGSRLACVPTCRATPRRSPMVIRWRLSAPRSGCATRRSASTPLAHSGSPECRRRRPSPRSMPCATTTPLPRCSAPAVRYALGSRSRRRRTDLGIRQTGPVQIPFMTFVNDSNFERANVFCLAAVQRGVYLHPWHNWFVSAAHSDDDILATLNATDEAFRAVREQFGEDK